MNKADKEDTKELINSLNSSEKSKKAKNEYDYTIEEVCSRFSSGKSITAKRISSTGQYPVYGGNGVRGYTDNYNFEGQCAVIGRQGAYCGNVKFFDGKAYMSEHAIVGVTRQEHDNRYFAYKLMLLNLGRYSGQAAQPGLSVTKLKALKITMPIFGVQQKIASILSTYDTLIENNNRRIRLLEQMAENLYKEWFVRFRFPGHEKVEMENGLPKGWKIKRIADFGRIETGKTPPMSNQELYGGDILFVKTPDMHEKMFVSSTSETLSQEGNNYQLTKLLPVNSIMVSCIGTAGVVSINAKSAHTNQQINSIILNNLEDLEWLYYVCRQLKPTIELFGATGATMTNLSKSKFEKLKIVVPKVDIRNSFHKRIRPYFKDIFTLEQQNTLLTRQRDLLLPRLMSGKLEVKP